jgi:hypothetical protein
VNLERKNNGNIEIAVEVILVIISVNGSLKFSFHVSRTQSEFLKRCKIGVCALPKSRYISGDCAVFITAVVHLWISDGDVLLLYSAKKGGEEVHAAVSFPPATALYNNKLMALAGTHG